MNALMSLMREPAVERLGWVLIHFLWEGTAIGLLLAVLLAVLSRASSHVRYLLICSALLACAIAPVGTWTVLSLQERPQDQVMPALPMRLDAGAPNFARPPMAPFASAPDFSPQSPVTVEKTTPAIAWYVRMLRMLDEMAPYAVFLWICGILVLTARFAFGWAGLQRLRRSGSAILDSAWQERFGRLEERMRVSTPVRWLQSALVEVPTVIGWLRPVILLPASVFTGLTPEQIEAVLAHELAHVHRCDYLVNLIQTVIETVLFYHPAVWWISRKLRDERENCCDDIAVETTRDRAVYAGALAALEMSRAHSSPLALAASGGSLLARIRRIAGIDCRRSSLAPLIAAILIIGGLMIPPAGHTASGQQAPEKAAPNPAAQAAIDEQALPGEMIAAARAGDSKKIYGLLKLYAQLRNKDQILRESAFHTAFQAIDEALRERDLRAFTTMYDLFPQFAFSKDWKLSDESLAGLVQEGHSDFLDALLARGFDLQRLTAQAGVADMPTAAWIARRVAEVAKQRADVEDLCTAAGKGDLPAIRHLLAAGVDANCVGKDHNTPLIRAVFKNQLEAAQMLLDHGAEVDKPRFPGWDYTPLCLVNSVPMAELLKKNGANVHAKLFKRDVSILTYAVKFAKADVVQWFLKQGLNPKMVGDGDRSLLFFLSDANTAKLLLDAGVDPNRLNKFGEPPIASAQNAEVAQTLIDHGARLTGFDRSLLLMMVNGGSAGAMEAVLKAGADHDQLTLQSTLAMVERFSAADIPEIPKMRQLLLANGAKPVPKSSLPAAEKYYEIAVSASDGEFLGDGKTFLDELVTHGGPGGVFGTQGGHEVQQGKTTPVWVPDDAASVSLAAEREGWAPAFAGPFAAPFDQLKTLKLMLTEGFKSSVVIVDEEGHPISGAKLKGQYPGPPEVGGLETVTSGSGTALLRHIGAAPLNLQVSANGYQADEIPNIHLNPATPYRWTLKRATLLRGIVTTADTAKPIAGAKIKLAGERGPHEETHSDPDDAPILAVSDAQGRFTLASLRSDSRYYLYVDAPGRGGQFLSDIHADQSELKVILGPELTVHGRVLRISHMPPEDAFSGRYIGGYDQSFKFGNNYSGTGHNIELMPKNDEADFTIGPLYSWPVTIRIGGKEINLEAKELPKNDLVIDLAPNSAGAKDEQYPSGSFDTKAPTDAELPVGEITDFDIHPDGTTHISGTLVSINHSQSPVDHVEFWNKNWIKVEKMGDGQGHPLHYEVTPQGADTELYQVTLNQPVPPGGKIVRTYECTMPSIVNQTEGPGVFKFDTDQSSGADAVTYRYVLELPAGAQLLWKNSDALKEGKSGDRITLSIDQRIPPNSHLIVNCRYKLVNARHRPRQWRNDALAVSRTAFPTSASIAADFAQYAMKLQESGQLKIEPLLIAPTANDFSPPSPGGGYPWKKDIVTEVFWVGQPGGGSSSVWDPNWERHYGGVDDPKPSARDNYLPAGFTPRLNPFYCELPYNDVTRNATKPEASFVIPWFMRAYQKNGESVCRNRWIEIQNRSGRSCFAQWSECGPVQTDNWEYVFGNARPASKGDHGAGLGVSPAVRDFLELSGTDVTSWRFVDYEDVTVGPWSKYGDNNDFVINAGRNTHGVHAETITFGLKPAVNGSGTDGGPPTAPLLQQTK